MKGTLPASPNQKADIIESLISSSRATKILSKGGAFKIPEEDKKVKTLKDLASDTSNGFYHIKNSGSSKERRACQYFKLLVFGGNIAKARAKKSLSKLPMS